MAAVIWEDFFSHRAGDSRFAPRTQAQQARWVKWIGCVVGIASVGLAFLAEPLGGIIKTLLSVIGATAGPLVGLFILGIAFPFANKRGAVAGVIVSVTVTVFISVGNAILKPYASYSLPLSTDNCSIWNVTGPNVMITSLIGDNLTATVGLAGEAIARGGAILSPLSGWKSIFGISDMLYSIIGIMLVLLVGIPVSLGDIWWSGRRRATDLYEYHKSGAERSISNESGSSSAHSDAVSDKNLARSLTMFWDDSNSTSGIESPARVSSTRNSRRTSKGSASTDEWYNCDESYALGEAPKGRAETNLIVDPNGKQRSSNDAVFV